MPINMRDAVFAPVKRVRLTDAIGQQSASNVVFYPPGSGPITLGMTVTEEAVETLLQAHEAGFTINGCDMSGDQLITVVNGTSKLCGPNNTKGYDIATYKADELTKKQVTGYCDLFRESFANANSQYVFNLNDPLNAIGPGQVIDAEPEIDGHYYSLNQLDSYALGNNEMLWMDPDRTSALLTERFADEGYVTLLTERETGAIKGLLHSRIVTVQQYWETEEFHNPILFSKLNDPKLLNDPDQFYERMKHHFELEKTDKVFVVSGQALHPQYRGRDNCFQHMMGSQAKEITPRHAALPTIAEIHHQGAGHVLNRAVNKRHVYGIPDDRRSVVFSKRLSDALWHYEGPPERLRFSIRLELSKLAGQFQAHKMDNPKVEVRQTSNRGRGVFASADIKAGETIAKFVGESYKSHFACSLPDKIVDHAVQVGPEEYISADGRLAELVNHSCEPNCGIKNLTEIFAVEDIVKGTEISWDYRLTEDSDWELNQCDCGSQSCFGRVDGWSSLPHERQQEYLSKNMVSEWIVNKMSVGAERDNE